LIVYKLRLKKVIHSDHISKSKDGKDKSICTPDHVEDEEENKVLIVLFSYTRVDPDTMMVESRNAESTHLTVARQGHFRNLTDFAFILFLVNVSIE
jgi:hypothetical protein